MDNLDNLEIIFNNINIVWKVNPYIFHNKSNIIWDTFQALKIRRSLKKTNLIFMLIPILVIVLTHDLEFMYCLAACPIALFCGPMNNIEYLVVVFLSFITLKFLIGINSVLLVFILLMILYYLYNIYITNLASNRLLKELKSKKEFLPAFILGNGLYIDDPTPLSAFYSKFPQLEGNILTFYYPLTNKFYDMLP